MGLYWLNRCGCKIRQVANIFFPKLLIGCRGIPVYVDLDENSGVSVCLSECPCMRVYVVSVSMYVLCMYYKCVFVFSMCMYFYVCVGMYVYVCVSVSLCVNYENMCLCVF